MKVEISIYDICRCGDYRKQHKDGSGKRNPITGLVPDERYPHWADERQFPPPTITRWVEHQVVSTHDLAAELRWWADWASEPSLAEQKEPE